MLEWGAERGLSSRIFYPLLFKPISFVPFCFMYLFIVCFSRLPFSCSLFCSVPLIFLGGVLFLRGEGVGLGERGGVRRDWGKGREGKEGKLQSGFNV